MEAYQFCFDHSGFAISEDCKWAQVDLNPAIGHGAQCDMMRMLMRRFPPAATVVLNFPVWQNTPEAQRMVQWITHRFAEKRPVDVSAYFPFATADEMWKFVFAVHDNVRTLEVACEQRVDGVNHLWQDRPRLEQLTVVPAADGKCAGPRRVFRRGEAE